MIEIKICMILERFYVVSTYTGRGRNRLTIDRHVEFLWLKSNFREWRGGDTRVLEISFIGKRYFCMRRL